MHAARTLDSPQEYKSALTQYAKKLADEGFRAKAEELIKELFGPTYWCVYLLECSVYGEIHRALGDREETTHGHQHCWAFLSVIC